MPETPWWQQRVIYQLLVPSYSDSDGDGLGDLPGLLDKLDYLQWLGVGAVWLSPVHPSPMRDMGYDVTDHRGINPRFGSLETFDALVREAHARDLKVLLDFVPNHTSNEHPWFEESRGSRDNPKRDWYVWADPGPDGGPPNNWLGVFGGSAWTLDEATGQYYYHVFLPEQPDLNWRNAEVQEAMLDALQFWLDRGVDGFRIDAIDLLLEDDGLRDNPENPDFDPQTDAPDQAVRDEHTRDHPEVHGAIARMREAADAYGDRFLAGELYLPPEKLAAYYGGERPELHLPLNPSFTRVDWSADALGDAVGAYLGALPEGAWPAWMLSTHDGPRLASRIGARAARAAAVLLLTLRGTPSLYYGAEIGMHDVDVPPDRQRDPQGERIGRSRDPQRTPMQWDGGPQASFTTGEPWLPVADDYERLNVHGQSDDPRSILQLYRRLLALRRDEPALTTGAQSDLTREGDLLAYEREGDGRRLLVVLNLGGEPREFGLAERGFTGRVLLSSGLDREGEEVGERVTVREHEGLILAAD